MRYSDQRTQKNWFEWLPTLPSLTPLPVRFPVTTPRQDDELEVLVGAVRLIHRTLSVSPPAAAAVAAGGAPRENRSGATAAPSSVAAALDSAAALSSPPPISASVGARGSRLFGATETAGGDGSVSFDDVASGRKGKGMKRRRPESEDACGDYDRRPSSEDDHGDRGGDVVAHADRVDRHGAKKDGGDDNSTMDVVDGDGGGGGGPATAAGEGPRARHHQQQRRKSCYDVQSSSKLPPSPSCAVFIAGEPMASRDVLASAPAAAPASVLYVATAAPRLPPAVAVIGGRVSDEMKGRGLDWAGKRGEQEIGARLKGQLMAVFHRGVFCGCPALVEASLQVR